MTSQTWRPYSLLLFRRLLPRSRFPFCQFTAHGCDLGVDPLLLGFEFCQGYFWWRNFGLRNGKDGLGEPLESLSCGPAQGFG